MDNNALEKMRKQCQYKSNELIQKSRYTMTAQQYDLLSFLISKIRKGDEPDTTYIFTIKEFCILCNKDYKNGWYYKSIKDDLQKIADTSVYVPYERNGKQREKLVRWLNKVDVENGGTLEVSFHYTIYPYLFGLTEKYTAIPIEYILPLSTFHYKRLYEILRSYLITPEELRKEYIAYADNYEAFQAKEYKTVRIFTLEDIKREMWCHTYNTYYDFKRYVLEKAIDEINTYTDIEVSFQGKTSKGSGRTITHIQFEIKLVRYGSARIREINRADYFHETD